MISFSDIVNEWRSATNQPYNAEWAGANPTEYASRQEREAQAWKRGQLRQQGQANSQANLRKIEEDKRTYEQQLRERTGNLQNLGNIVNSNNLDQFNQYNTQNANTRASYDSSIGQQKNQLSSLLSGLIGQYDQAFANTQGQVGSSLADVANQFNLGRGAASQYNQYAQQLGQERMLAFQPNLATPGAEVLGGMTGANNLFQSTMSRLAEAYGTGNQAKMNQLANPLLDAYQSSNKGAGDAYLGMRDTVSKSPTGLGGGLFEESQYNMKLSQQQQVNQQIQAAEQGVLSQISQMYNLANSFSNQVNNEISQDKAQRVNERSIIQGSKAEEDYQNKVRTAEANSARQSANRRAKTRASSNPLIQLLTRGN